MLKLSSSLRSYVMFPFHECHRIMLVDVACTFSYYIATPHHCYYYYYTRTISHVDSSHLNKLCAVGIHLYELLLKTTLESEVRSFYVLIPIIRVISFFISNYFLTCFRYFYFPYHELDFEEIGCLGCFLSSIAFK